MDALVHFGGQFEPIGNAPQFLLRWARDIQKKDCCFEARAPIIDSLAAHNHAGQILANSAVFRTDGLRADSHRKLCPEWKAPTRTQNDPGIRYAQIRMRPETTIDPVVEINRELCALGIT